MLDDRASIIMQFVFALLSTRIHGMLVHFHCYPLAFAALLGDEQDRTSELVRMERLWSAWQHCQVKGQGSYWSQIQRRSFMHWSFNQIMFAMAAEVGFKEVTPAMQHFIQAFTAGTCTTKQTEDLFQKGRSDERSGQMNDIISQRR
eukprot:5899501-Lingulodinium_polyedra.AAC.1